MSKLSEKKRMEFSKEKKPLIWILGGYGSGKTTQCKKIVNNLVKKGDEPEDVYLYSGDKLVFYYVFYKKSGIAIIGKMGKNQCTGLDSIYSKLGVEGVSYSIEMALKSKGVKLILVECVFGTFSWYQDWVKRGLREHMNLIFIHLELNLWNNFRRIQQRRATKEGVENWKDVELEDSVYKNAGNKNRETRVIYQKLAGKHEKSKSKLADHIVQYDAIQPEQELFMKIMLYLGQVM